MDTVNFWIPYFWIPGKKEKMESGKTLLLDTALLCWFVKCSVVLIMFGFKRLFSFVHKHGLSLLKTKNNSNNNLNGASYRPILLCPSGIPVLSPGTNKMKTNENLTNQLYDLIHPQCLDWVWIMFGLCLDILFFLHENLKNKFHITWQHM